MADASDVKELKWKGSFSFLMIDRVEAEGRGRVASGDRAHEAVYEIHPSVQSNVKPSRWPD